MIVLHCLCCDGLWGEVQAGCGLARLLYACRCLPLLWLLAWRQKGHSSSVLRERLQRWMSQQQGVAPPISRACLHLWVQVLGAHQHLT